MSRVDFTYEDLNRIYSTIEAIPIQLREWHEKYEAEIADLDLRAREAEAMLKVVVDGNQLLQQLRRWRKLGGAMIGWVQPHKNDYRVGQQAPANCQCEACSTVREAKELLSNPA